MYKVAHTCDNTPTQRPYTGSSFNGPTPYTATTPKSSPKVPTGRTPSSVPGTRKNPRDPVVPAYSPVTVYGGRGNGTPVRGNNSPALYGKCSRSYGPTHGGNNCCPCPQVYTENLAKSYGKTGNDQKYNKVYRELPPTYPKCPSLPNVPRPPTVPYPQNFRPNQWSPW